jgi:hypothetical protein
VAGTDGGEVKKGRKNALHFFAHGVCTFAVLSRNP